MNKPPLLIIALLVLVGCVTPARVSTDHDYNYARVFHTMTQPKPVVVNSRLEQYTKDFGLWRGRERNGEWEFELLASRAWVEALKSSGFKPVPFERTFRKPAVAWWNPAPDRFDAFEMPYTSYPAAHLYVERTASDESRIQVFVQRH